MIELPVGADEEVGLWRKPFPDLLQKFAVDILTLWFRGRLLAITVVSLGGLLIVKLGDKVGEVLS